jgi:hypothetical protein
MVWFAASHVSPDQSEFPYLGAEEVVDETMRLLAKLETDRQDTLAKLAQERERVKTLGQKIDKLAEKRLLDIPVAVQKGRVEKTIFDSTPVMLIQVIAHRSVHWKYLHRIMLFFCFVNALVLPTYIHNTSCKKLNCVSYTHYLKHLFRVCDTMF